MPRSKTEQDYHTLAKSRGFVWVGQQLPPRVKIKTSWQCSQGHQWRASHDFISQGGKCPFCSKNSRLIAEHYHLLAQERGYQWLGKRKPRTGTLKTLWRCDAGHEFEASYASIRNTKYGCAECDKVRARKRYQSTPEDYHQLAHDRNYQWIGKVLPDNYHQKTTWICDKGHKFRASMVAMKNSPHGCRQCANKRRNRHRRLKPSDYHRLASSRGFEWLGAYPKNNATKTTWRCSEGHMWKSRYDNIQQGTGCPHCEDMVNGYKTSSQQRTLATMLDAPMNVNVAGYCVDLFITLDDTKIAIEYDGYYWHKDLLEKDLERNRAILTTGCHLLVIKSNESLPTDQQIYDALLALTTKTNFVEIILPDWGA